MMRYTFTMILLSATSALAADARSEAGYYIGTVGTHLAVTMTLAPYPGDLEGDCRYLRYGPAIFLENQTKPGGDIELTESGTTASNKTGGHFRGTLDEASQLFTGTWTSATGARSLPFSLKRIATVQEFSAVEPRNKVSDVVPQFTRTTPFYVALTAELARKAREDVRSNTADFDKESPGDDDTTSYFSKITVEVLHADDSMVSLLYLDCCYSGGAHENCGTEAVNYLWRGGKLIALKPSDMLAANAVPKLAELILADLNRQHAAWPQQADLSALDNLNMTPTSTGLMFTFDPYEVDCFAAGCFTVMLPYKQVQSMIPPTSPLRKFVP